MDDKITIIEGPTPAFEQVSDGWVLGLNESPYLYDMAQTRLRTFNGPALVERCHRAWQNLSTIYLEYRDEIGLQAQVPILAARNTDTADGQLLILWVRRDPDGIQAEIDQDDDEDDAENPF